VGRHARFGYEPAETRWLPVVSALAELLPEGGIRRGATVGVAGSTSLALAVGARASARGSWCAAVGARALGLLSVAELGYDTARFVLIDAREPLAWARAVAALVDPCDVVLAWPPASLGLKHAEQVRARARERDAVLVVAGRWPGRTDLMLTVTRATWIGIDRGAGRLRARRVEVEVTGRGAASLGRRGVLWLPGPDGEIELAERDDVHAAQAAR